MTTPERRPAPRRRRLTVVVAGLVALVSVLAGCTGVPQSSRPEVVKPLPVGAGGSQAAPYKVPHDIVPHDLVQKFLTYNSLSTGNYASARNFLTPAARSRWQDTTATIVDTTTIGIYSPRKPQIIVHGPVLGTLDQNGVYTPAAQGPAGPETRAFTFRIASVHGQFRISSLSSGLLLTESQFETSFFQRNLYFYDLAQKYLVPDPRWSALTDSTQLDEWLLTQLADGPTQPLASAVNPLPAQANARRINVTVGSPTKIEIPGTSQLGGAARAQLAAQVATTLDPVEQGTFEITDGGSPVRVPSLGRAVFAAADFSDSAGPPQPAGDVYFTRDGKLVSGADFKPVSGEVNDGHFYIGRVAVSRSTPTGELSVAAVAAPKAAKEELVVGTQAAGLQVTSVRGELSWPAFTPGRNEVWIGGVGDGSRIDLVDITGRSAKITKVGLPAALAGGQIIALKPSPEGSRIAVVIKNPSGIQQLYIGAVVRDGGLVRIGTLLPISPLNVIITDMGWIEPTKLYATGYTASSQNPHVYETDVDGSVWTQMGIGIMPSVPTSFTVAPGQAAWAESDGTLWVQSGGSNWKSAGPTGQTTGSNPVYLG